MIAEACVLQPGSGTSVSLSSAARSAIVWRCLSVAAAVVGRWRCCLRELKSAYDPNNVLDRNFPIPSAPDRAA